jgi:hypothetical protein
MSGGAAMVASTFAAAARLNNGASLSGSDARRFFARLSAARAGNEKYPRSSSEYIDLAAGTAM